MNREGEKATEDGEGREGIGTFGDRRIGEQGRGRDNARRAKGEKTKHQTTLELKNREEKWTTQEEGKN